VTTDPGQTGSVLSAVLAGYARRLHRAAGAGHQVMSPLGAWLLLALCAPASTGRHRSALTEVLGCDAEAAARLAAGLLARPHPLVPSAAAVWTAPGAPLSVAFESWRAGLPAAVQSGPLLGQAALDAWARDHTAGLIERFPLSIDPSVYLVLATALATRVSWEVPFDLTPGAALGERSPWAGRLRQVLRTPDADAAPPGTAGLRAGGHAAAAGAAHQQFIASTPEAGDVAVHLARARGGLLVASVAAAADMPSAEVLAVAQRLACASAMGQEIPRRALAELPLGEAPLWRVREERGAGGDVYSAVLPAWSARSQIPLTDPELGFGAAIAALSGEDPWKAAQAAMARYSRTGFEAAAVTAVAAMMAAFLPRPGVHRVAELRFAHPYAVVAVARQPGTRAGPGSGAESGPGSGPGPWHGVPVFSAWVADPSDAAEDEADGPIH
jgi:Serpin (serine protease inhibitor)